MPESGKKKGPGDISQEDIDTLRSAFRCYTTMHVENLTDEELKVLYQKLEEQSQGQ